MLFWFKFYFFLKGGDFGYIKYDVEIFGYYLIICGYKFDFCKFEKLIWVNIFLKFGVWRVIIFVVNNYVRIINDNGFEVKGCYKCVFVFNG